MGGFVELLKRFHSDERGVFAVIFGVMAIVLVAFGGAAVDYTAVETARSRAQFALDSAALGLQPTIFASPAPTETTLKSKALALVEERVNDSAVELDVDVADANAGNGTLHLEGTITVRTAFVQLVGIPSISARIVSEATRKRLNLEVAMVLDNSGSMAQKSRMTNLKQAARCAMNVLLNAIEVCTDTSTENNKPTTEPNILIGIVPFTGFVNVGPGYKNASWMDTTGLSSIANDNFDEDDDPTNAYGGKVNRFALYSTLGVTWRGCVEARPYPYDTNDTEPSAANPDTLFVPEFAPDNADTAAIRISNYDSRMDFTLNPIPAYNNNFKSDTPSACDSTGKDLGLWSELQTKSGCSTNYSSSNNYDSRATKFDDCTRTLVKGSRTYTNWAGTTQTAPSTMPASQNGKNGKALYPTCYYTYPSGSTTGGNLSRTLNCRYFFSDLVRQERLCKYTSGVGSGSNYPGSPNQDCPTNSLMPLTTVKATVLDAINDMAPQGYTNIHQGAIWGYHMLTPSLPLDEANEFTGSTSKVMIIMTDGENTIDGYGTGPAKARTMQAYGYPINGRIFSTDYPNPSSDAQITAAMDSRAAETCANAKAAGITIYTIGLEPPTQKTRDLLTGCASDADKAYFPDDASELTGIFLEIANDLANLRLSL